MDATVDHRPSFALLTVDLDAGESVRAEAGAMVAHDDGIDVETSTSGGLLDSVKRSVLGGESFFQNTYTAREPGTVSFAPPLPGDVVRHDLAGEPLFVQSGAFLASAAALDLDTAFGGAKTFFGGEGLFLLELSGTGPAFLASYGAIQARELAPGERFVVDTGHVVAFESSTTFDVRRVGGLKSTLFSGEGLVCDFEGPGRVWLQSRSQDAFLAWLVPQLPSQQQGG
ncbi:MAG: TIGR00266 family protein [Halobacteriales archaeon]